MSSARCVRPEVPAPATALALRLVKPELGDLPVELWTLEEAAAAMKLGPTYLLASDCPRLRLPSNSTGSKRGPVRFDPILVMQWARSFRTDSP